MIRQKQRILVTLSLTLLGSSLAWAGTFEVSGKDQYQLLKSQLQAAQFLARATFGSTEAEVDSLAASIRAVGQRRALSDWIDTQAALPPSLHEPLVLQLLSDDGYANPYANRPPGASGRNNYREFAWWQMALQAPDQLRQRVAFALMQLVVINRDVGVFNNNAADSSNQPRYTGIVHYNDMLVENAFDRYNTILQKVTYHPVMGNFLTHINNRKPSADGLLLPDENYAREILQLFTMGEFRMDISGVFVKDRLGRLVQNYTNDDIKTLARVFTGLRYAIGNGSTSVNLHDPMEVRNFNDHDFDEKLFPTLQLYMPPRTPSAAQANEEIQIAVELIFRHPNVGPLIAKHLIQRLVKANPSGSYIRDVAQVFNNNGQNVRGDLLAVVRAILLHREAIRSQRYSLVRDANRNIVGLRVRTRGTEHAKLVEPMIRYTQFIKLFNGQPSDPQRGFRIRPSQQDLSQLPYRAPSVFNYFRPDHQPPGFQNYVTSRRIPNSELYSPEAQIYTPVFANRFQNLLYRHLHQNRGGYNSISFSNAFATEEALAQSGLNSGSFVELLERLDRLMCHGSLRDESKQVINNVLINSGNTNANEIARLAIYGVLGTPECAIDE